MTRFAGLDVDEPSLGGHTITFAQGGRLYALDLPSRTLREVPVAVPDDGARTRPRLVPAGALARVTDALGGVDYALSPDGGDLFDVPAAGAAHFPTATSCRFNACRHGCLPVGTACRSVAMSRTLIAATMRFLPASFFGRIGTVLPLVLFAVATPGLARAAPCSGTTQAALGQCAETDRVAADKRLNQAYGQVVARLQDPDDQRQRDALRDAENIWIRFRDAE